MNSRRWRIWARARSWVSFPLLAKELTESAARPRTYVLRIVYAVALYSLFALNFSRQGGYSHAVFGTGERMFESLMLLQFFGVMLFLPALMCGRITQEKERDSLVLLFLTDLRPWSIILQKYAGGLVPMLSFLLLSMPLAGVAYAFGGLQTAEIARTLLGLLLTCLQIGALALMCSAWCRSTVGALLATYFLGVALYAVPPLSWQLIWELVPSLSQNHARWELERYGSLFVPADVVEFDTSAPFARQALLLVPSLLSTLIFLALARLFLVRRAFVPPANFLRKQFERIDRLMKRANRATGGIVFWQDAQSLPDREPIFWRETQRRLLGKPHYLIRLLYLVEIPTLLVCFAVALLLGVSYARQADALSALAAVLSALSALILSVQAANTLVSERVGQTLEVLLTTPLSAPEIIRQKERALRRLQLVLAVPLLTVFACEAALEHNFGSGVVAGGWVAYSVCSLSLVLIYLPLITWLSLWIGLRVRTRFQAIVSALAALTVWAALSPLLFALLEGTRDRWLVLLSPLSVGIVNEVAELHQVLPDFDSPWPVIVINAAFYAAIALLIRMRLFADAERCLRR